MFTVFCKESVELSDFLQFIIKAINKWKLIVDTFEKTCYTSPPSTGCQASQSYWQKKMFLTCVWLRTIAFKLPLQMQYWFCFSTPSHTNNASTVPIDVTINHALHINVYLLLTTLVFFPFNHPCRASLANQHQVVFQWFNYPPSANSCDHLCL